MGYVLFCFLEIIVVLVMFPVAIGIVGYVWYILIELIKDISHRG